MIESQGDAKSSYPNQPRRHFSREFKRQLVERLLNSEATLAEVAREYELHPNQLCRWRNEYRHKQVSLPVPAQIPTLLPVVMETEPPVAKQPSIETNEIGLRLSLARGQVDVFNGCMPELLRAAVEALR